MAKAQLVSQGAMVDYTPTTAVAAGDVVVQGELVGIATRAIPANTLGALAVAGVFDVAKGDIAFAAGDLVYWNATEKVAVKVPGGGNANKLMGKAVSAAAQAASTVRVLLSQ